MAKRKRDIDDQQQSQATFILSEPVTGPGPALGEESLSLEKI